jgi:hypothetical protein
LEGLNQAHFVVETLIASFGSIRGGDECSGRSAIERTELGVTDEVELAAEYMIKLW